MIKSMMFKMRQLFLITIDTRISTIYINDSISASFECPSIKHKQNNYQSYARKLG